MFGLIRYFDAETTGLDLSEIVQVGIVASDGRVLFDSLVQCQGDISQEAIEVHGITKDDLVSAPTWPEIHDQVCELLSQADLIKIYNARFDLRLLYQTAKRYGLEVPTIRAECVMVRYANLQCEGTWQSLSAACHYEAINITDFNAHNAVGDCQITRLLDIEIERLISKRKKAKAYKEKARLKKLSLVPSNIEGYPYFGAGLRPKGYKTLSQLKMSDLNQYEFAGMCCDTYGNRGHLFKPLSNEI